MDKKLCVYKHTNKINGKCYIGITSKNPNERWGIDGVGYKGQYFYEAILKYGWENFLHEILYTDLTVEQACDKEIALINYYKSNNPKFGYNQSIGGEWISYDKPVVQYDLDGNFIKVFGSRAEAANELNIGSDVISVAISRQVQACNYQFRDWNGNNSNISKYNKRMAFRKINLYNIDGKYIKTFDGIKYLSDELNIDRSTIWECLKNNRPTCYKNKQNYYFKYYDDILNYNDLNIENKYIPNIGNKGRRVGKYDVNMNLLCEYKNVAEAIRNNNNNYGIYNCVKNRAKTSNGFIWKYLD